MTKPETGSNSVTIYVPDRNGTPEPLHLDLPAVPDVRNLSLQQALFGQLPHWGLRRTLDAYRRAVESGVNVLGAISAFYEAKVEAEVATEHWHNIDTIRQAEKLKIHGELAYRQVEHNKALIALNKAQIDRAISEDTLKDIDSITEEERKKREADRQIQELNRATALAEARWKKEEADRRLAGQQAGEGGSSFKDMLKQQEEAGKNFELLEKRKAEDIKKYGSKEAMPEFMQAWYEQLEDALFKNTE